MPYTFSPPARTAIPRYTADDAIGRTAAYRLFRHVNAGLRCVNVWKLTSGTFVESTPYDQSTVAVEYLGGRVHVVSSGEAEALTAAGYQVTFVDDGDPGGGGEPGGGGDSGGGTVVTTGGYAGAAYGGSAYGG